MHATCVEDLQVYQRAKQFFASVSSLTSTFRTDFWLSDQLNDSAESVMSNIAEGFRQATDRAFAHYLNISQCSALESRSHLTAAEIRRHVDRARCAELMAEAQEIANMLGGLIKHLRRSDRKNRFP